ncbi:MAG: hypothetical protein WCV85_05525 [Patescibacteria group bacterium]|jgi:hypothetical protein
MGNVLQGIGITLIIGAMLAGCAWIIFRKREQWKETPSQYRGVYPTKHRN